jgi:lathosterol oxidase
MLLIVNIYPISYENFMYSMAFVPYLAIAADFYFYVVHRPLHTKWLWRFHRAHHAGDISVVRSLDADMLEHLVANIGMVLVGISSLWWCDIVLNFGVLVFWTAFATISTCISHSHGKMPFDNGIHYVHHCTLTANYGFGIYFPDRVLGTFKNNTALNR